MSFATVKANLEKEGASLLYKLKDELREELDVFRSRTSESYNEIIIQMQRYLIIAESVAVVTKTWNDLKPPKTIYNHLQPPQKIQQPPTTIYNHLKNIYNHLQTI